jgi:putative transposase
MLNKTYLFDNFIKMKYDPQKHHRRSIRLKGYDYSQPGGYFVTIVTKSRDLLFGEVVTGKMILNDAGKMIQCLWRELLNRFINIELYEFSVMPNHFHGILMITEKMNNTLGDIIGAFESITTDEYILGVKNNGWHRFDKKLWQRNYWEHIIRDENELNRIREYIINNPMQWETDHENPNHP